MPNIANITVRLGLLFGVFEYRDRGILDFTHLRFFTMRTIRREIENAGFRIIAVRGSSVPIRLIIGWMPDILLRIGERVLTWITRIWRGAVRVSDHPGGSAEVTAAARRRSTARSAAATRFRRNRPPAAAEALREDDAVIAGRHRDAGEQHVDLNRTRRRVPSIVTRNSGVSFCDDASSVFAGAETSTICSSSLIRTQRHDGVGGFDMQRPRIGDDRFVGEVDVLRRQQFVDASSAARASPHGTAAPRRRCGRCGRREDRVRRSPASKTRP